MTMIDFIGPLYAVAFLAACCTVRLLWLYVKFRTSPYWSLPGPRDGSFVTGQFGKIRSEPFLEPHRRWWRKSGLDTKFIHYSLPLGTHSLMVLDADIVKEILFSNYGENPRFTKKLRGLIPLSGNGLVTLEGKDWQRHRRIIHPFFQPGQIRESLGNCLPKVMSRFIGYWEKVGGREIEVNTHMSMLTLDIIGEVAFSHNFHGLDSLERWIYADDQSTVQENCVNDKVMAAMTDLFRNTSRRILFNVLSLSFLDFSTMKASKMLDEAVDEVISEARRKLEKQKKIESCNDSKDENASGTKSSISLLQRLLDAENSDVKKSSRNSLAREELRDEVKTFILAGHETTSTWCYWSIFALCRYPDIQQKVFEDIEKHSHKDKKTDISIEMTQKMIYFNAFMKEVLRLYPSAGMIIRHSAKEEVFKGIKVSANTRLTIPIHLLHRHPKYWKDPETFMPERWLGEEHPSSHKYAFMPFSNGPRNCIGYHFAEMEAKLLLAPLIRHFHIRLAESLRGTNFTFTNSITMKSKPFLKINISSRE
mmetsp:Transcript_26859/g.73859  ORF Transcript_26859/g.73859 Transcript_26859/m.73859 type:complete len:535 (-) Transcript_26859:90-1694(-)